MKHLLADALHIFVIFIMATFVIGAILALTGTFDHWGSRYVLKKRRRRLLKTKARSEKNDSSNKQSVNFTPYQHKRPSIDINTVTPQSRFA